MHSQNDFKVVYSLVRQSGVRSGQARSEQEAKPDPDRVTGRLGLAPNVRSFGVLLG